MSNLKSCSVALKEFRTKYPSVTSTDLQTFILGFNAAETTLVPITTKQGLIVDCLFIKKLNRDHDLYLSQDRLAIVDCNTLTFVRSLDILDFIYDSLK